MELNNNLKKKIKMLKINRINQPFHLRCADNVSKM